MGGEERAQGRGRAAVGQDGGADVAAKDDMEWTALHLAAREGTRTWSRCSWTRWRALTSPRRVNMDGRRYIWRRREGTRTWSRCCWTRGADVAAKDDYGWTALHLAAGRGHKDVVALLLDRGAPTSPRRTKDGQTALHLAAGSGHKDVVALLLDKGADVAATTEDGLLLVYVFIFSDIL